MNIRDNAIHCEAKKHAYRQTQDGVVVSFVLHPHEVPDGLATASLGTRYMLALVEIGDNEEPKASQQQGRPTGSTRADYQPGPTTGKETEASASRTSQSWHEMKLSQQAGVLCNDPVFQKFLHEGVRLDHGKRAWSRPVSNTDDAAEAVRYLCAVNSRADLDKGNVSGDRWREIVSLYRAWVREPEIVG